MMRDCWEKIVWPVPAGQGEKPADGFGGLSTLIRTWFADMMPAATGQRANYAAT
jgi:hypothetical protein